ncbi:FAD-dependent oxidoreductase [Algoriphagus chordae]|uniref:D-amino-acid oxidase n=1 Tax=Algoriphagus chordae TaxID=237019 RepID=A0A2W7QMQ1_9BACT|nr:FAD-dependent oxidoreductase [Algoriphagus chordae]PZX49624.1 D-amino-acid:oxygen oxidoreductase (deaminating) [Algoriphagus chordae]
MDSVTVVGSGIIGLTSAILLQEVGFDVKLISKAPFDMTLSSKVGAIWFPFEIHPKEKTNTWATLAYQRYQAEVMEGNGVKFISFITAYTPESNIDWTSQLPAGKVRKARPEELPTGIEMAIVSEVPLAQPLLYLPHLFERFIAKGGRYQEQEISTLEELSTLDSLVINCTGLGAKSLCKDDDLHPMRGQILRCKKMDVASFANPTKKGALSYLINRSGDSVIGGTDYEDDWNESIDLADTELILSRLKASGISQNPEVLEVIVGLRPRRSAVRFEFDPKHPNVFHNYGHGGAGFTVAWGCAIELSEILSRDS